MRGPLSPNLRTPRLRVFGLLKGTNISPEVAS